MAALSIFKPRWKSGPLGPRKDQKGTLPRCRRPARSAAERAERVWRDTSFPALCFAKKRGTHLCHEGQRDP
jgi:hypothetical protein